MSGKRNLLKLSVFISVATASAFLSVPAFSATQNANRKELIAQNTPGTGQPTDTTNAPVEPSGDGSTPSMGQPTPPTNNTPGSGQPTDTTNAPVEPSGDGTTRPRMKRPAGAGGLNGPTEPRNNNTPGSGQPTDTTNAPVE
ncbi:MAG: hypothetical protein H0X31_21510, partial [Nostocaceae cyanobacterium]|nr:hypothetical protein [Nostocaceae cyanobacterium]